MLLGGLWHGAGLTFIAWGAFHGFLLALERLTRWPERIAPLLSGTLTLLLVINGWVLFRAHDFATAAALFQAMYTLRAGGVLPVHEVAMVIGMFLLVVGLMVMARTRGRLFDRIRSPSAPTGWAYGVAAGLGLVFVLLDAAPEPFIYFRF